MSVLIVALSGAMGAVARYQMYLLMQKQLDHSFPIPTLVINILGCFLIGMLMISVERAVPYNRHLFLIGATGFLGSFTTFSTFGFETFHLIRNNQMGHAVAYVSVSVIFGLVAIWAGRALISTSN